MIVLPTESRRDTEVAGGRVGSVGNKPKRPWHSAQASVRDNRGRHFRTGDDADSGLAVKQSSDSI